MRIRRDKIKEDKWSKLHYQKKKMVKIICKVKTALVEYVKTILSYNIKIKVDKYVTLKPPRKNL